MSIFSRSVANDRAPSRKMCASRLEDRTIDELVGICRGILFDAEVNSAEAQALHDWLLRNAGNVEEYPYNILLARLTSALRDGVIDESEEADLLFALSSFVGGEANGEFGSESASLSTELPCDSPLPTIDPECTFVVTGVFEYGPRAAIVEEIERRGGSVKSAVSSRVDYLVVGTIGSRDWMHSSYGRKIEQAISLRKDGVALAIVPERHWVASLR